MSEIVRVPKSTKAIGAHVAGKTVANVPIARSVALSTGFRKQRSEWTSRKP
jgi:hypothetical protein